MVVVVVFLAVALVALAVVTLVIARRRVAAQELAAHTADELGAVREELTRCAADRDAAGADRDRQRSRADAAEGRATSERHRADQATGAAEVATSRADAAEQGLSDLRRALDPSGLWVFERQRLCRLWRDWVSVTLDAPCPLPEDAAEALVGAVEIMASASREECGVPIDVRWELTPARQAGLGLAGVLVVLRAVEELVAAARGSDGAELLVTSASDGSDVLELSLTAEPARPVPAGLAHTSSGVGWQLARQDGSLVLRIPYGPS